MRIDREFAEKQRRVLDFLAREKLDGLLLSRHGNFAWITCGGSNHVAVNTDIGVAHVLLTRAGSYIICDNIEARRIMQEEVEGLGFEFESFQWHEGHIADALERIAPGARLGSDTGRWHARDVDARVSSLRASLLPQEVERYRAVGALTAQSMTHACRGVSPGMSEHEVAGLLAGQMLARGVLPVVLLIAADERAFSYRHPIPTDRRIDNHVMLVTCGRKWGLIVSMTRIIHFGSAPAELRRKHDAVTKVDAAFISATRPQARVGDIFQAAVDAYAAGGFPDEWRLHHQGGPTGYVGREFRATTESDQTVAENQAFAWNPSIAGTKSEDTIIALAAGPEVISPTPELPALNVEVQGRVIPRPDIVVA